MALLLTGAPFLEKFVDASLSSAAEILESMDEAFYAINRDWRFIYINRGAEKFWGRQREDLLGRSMLEAFPTFPGSEPHDAHARAMTSGERLRLETISTATKAPVELNLQPTPWGLAVYFRDITERRQMESELRERGATLTLAESTAGIGVWDVELASGMVRGTPQFFRIMGLAPTTEPIPIETMRGVRHPDDRERVVSGYRSAIDNGIDGYEVEYRIVRPDDGETRWIFGRGRVIRDPSGRPVRYGGVDIDITERKQAEAALAASQEQLRVAAAALSEMNQKLEIRVSERTAELEAEAARRAEAEARLFQAQKMEAVGQLTGGIAHDFNNLLTVVLGNLEMIRRRLETASADGEAGGLTAKLLRPIEMAMQGARNAAELTHRLLAFSRRQPLAPRAIEMNRLVASLSEMISRTLGETIEVATVLAPETWPAFADANQIESALLNLVVNARDAMPEGGRLIVETGNAHLDQRYAATAEGVAPGDYVTLSVSDTGSGIPPELLEKVLEPFFTTKEPGKGSGLGLSMVYGFAKQSGGHLRIYSEVGVGTTVKIYLPRFGEAVNAPATAATTDEALARARKGETVLVVEDNEGVRRYGVEVLAELGYRVLEATDGPAALQLLERTPAERIDLLFTDIVLPGGMSGREVAERAKVKRPGLPVLLTTGYAAGVTRNSDRLGAAIPVLGKPYTLEGLARKVREVIDGKA
jgi:PAS domain S-box-containing protein